MGKKKTVSRKRAGVKPGMGATGGGQKSAGGERGARLPRPFKGKVPENVVEAGNIVRPAAMNLELRDRVGMQGYFYHQHHGENPTSVDLGFWDFLEFQEQPYRRKMMIEEGKEILLDTDWVEHPGFVIFENVTGHAPSVNPTEEEKEYLEGQWLVIQDVFIVRPGCKYPVEVHPDRHQQIRLASARGKIIIWINAFSR